MGRRRDRGLLELYRDDPEAADWQVWGRRAEESSRRGFLRRSGLAAMAVFLGARIPFASHLPQGLVPAVLAASTEPFEIAGKDGLRVLNDRPLSAETPAHLLDDPVTPASRLFVRNNGDPPSSSSPQGWTLLVSGESIAGERRFTLQQLQSEFATHTYRLQLECAGNGRAEFYPPAAGNQWTTGAIGCPEWTGVRLGDVLRACGLRDDAVYVGYYGTDRHLSGEPDRVVISRGVPIAKALQPETLLAWAMNGEPLRELHGAPLRLICGGWPGSTSGKWLERLVVRDRVHDGEKMTGQSYRVPCSPVAPGTKVSDADMCIIESMPVRSLITFPRSGSVGSPGRPLAVRGHAWAGERSVSGVEISIDFARRWQPATLAPPANRLAWQRFSAEVAFPLAGYYEVWARAVDSQGDAQPMVLPGWNPRGYLNNACHRIAVRVT